MEQVILVHQFFRGTVFRKKEWQSKGRINVTDVTDRACACLKSVLPLGVDKDHRTSNWVLILYQTCTTKSMDDSSNGRAVALYFDYCVF